MCVPLRLPAGADLASLSVDVPCAPLLAWAALAHLEQLLPVLRDNYFYTRRDTSKHVFEVGTVFTENQNEMHKGVYPPGRIELLEAVPGKLLRYRMELPGAAAYFGGMDSEELVFEVRPHCSGELSTSTVTMRSTWRTTWIALPLLPFVPLALPVWHTRYKLQGSRLRQFVRQNNRPTRMEGVLRTLHRLHMPVPSDVPTEP